MALKLVPHPRFGRQPVPLGALAEWGLKDHPQADRIALRRSGEWDFMAELWNSRTVLARAVRMQERSAHAARPIRPVVPLRETEGY